MDGMLNLCKDWSWFWKYFLQPIVIFIWLNSTIDIAWWMPWRETFCIFLLPFARVKNQGIKKWFYIIIFVYKAEILSEMPYLSVLVWWYVGIFCLLIRNFYLKQNCSARSSIFFFCYVSYVHKALHAHLVDG